MKYMEIIQHEIETYTNSQIQGEIIFLEAMFPEHQQVDSNSMMAFKATSDPDTIYMHQAMKEEYKAEFKKSI